MLSIILDQVFKGSRFRDSIIRWSFFGLQGILFSILINDFIRVLYGDFDHKQDMQYGLAGIVALSPFIIPQLTLMDNRSNNMSMGLGMTIGTYIANRTEKKEPIIKI